MTELKKKLSRSDIFVFVNEKQPDKCSWKCPFNHTRSRMAAAGKCGLFGDCRITSAGGAFTAMVRSNYCKEMFG